jgi:methylenetetrahydrofolate dehydrogenase (NADP+)/methenyltetrahydrofolate cyclohydrolase
LPATLLDGRKLAQEIRAEIRAGVDRLRDRTGIVPGLTVILVGEDAASQVYVRNKENASRETGMKGQVLSLPADTSEAHLLETLYALNANPAVHAILVQLPLPRHLDDQTVIEAIDPIKDVDGFHPENVGRLMIGRPRFVPCTPLGVREMLIRCGIETRGKHAVVLGRSNIVGKPMAALLLGKGPGGDATVTVCHTSTRDVSLISREADLLVAAMGQPRAVKADWVRPGAVVIDVGIHRLEDGSLCGDVAFEEVEPLASAITPVPRGVGPMTVAMLLRNTLDAARHQAGLS